MSNVNVTLLIPDELAAKLLQIATRERRTLEAQATVFLEQIADSPEAFKRHGVGAGLTVEELIPHMPKGLRSRSSIQRLLKAGAITGTKVRGTWTFNLSEVESDIEQFKRVSSIAGLLAPTKQKRRGSR